MLALGSYTATAFAPSMAVTAPTVTRAAAPAMALADELGATGPLLPAWDPLGLVRALRSAPHSTQHGGSESCTLQIALLSFCGCVHVERHTPQTGA